MQQLTMEGRGCRREVPALTLVLFLGQKKASSTQLLQHQKKARVSASWGSRLLVLAWELGPIHNRLPAGEHVDLSAPTATPGDRSLGKRK